jgi:hypothetical protein
MVSGAQSAFEEMMSLRNCGRVMAQSDPPTFLLRWSDDSQTVFYGDILQVTMSDFRRLPRYFIDETESLCDDMMFGWKPPIDLSKLKDDMANTSRGFSFVQHPDNQLQAAYLELLDKACTTRRYGLYRDGSWDRKAVYAYIKKDDSLRAYLAGSLQTATGQVVRCKELFSLWCVNGEFGARGFCIYKGFMIFIIRHHKAKRSTNREFVVARFIPVQIGHSLFKYLVFIRPLVEMLYRELFTGQKQGLEFSPLFFRTELHAGSKPWTANRLTTIMKDATKKVWNRPVNSQLFRQLCIGITEKHVREVYEPFNRFDDTGAAADRNVVFAWQSGHRPLQRGTTYGLDGAFPTKLQPQLLHLYEWASTRWHEFLHLPSKKLPVHNGDGEPQIQQLREQGAMCQSNRAAVLDSSPVSTRELPTRMALYGIEGEDERRPTTSSSQHSGFPSADATDGMVRDAAPSDISLPPRKRRRLRESGCRPPLMRQDTTPELFASSELHTRNLREAESTPAFRQSMFRHPTDNTSQAATKECRRTIGFLQHYIKERSTTLATELRLDRVYKTAEWWKSVGCEFCFISIGRLEKTHEFETCNRHESDLAKNIFQWLNSLDLPRSQRGRGSCSLCTHTWHPCQEICKSYAITMA